MLTDTHPQPLVDGLDLDGADDDLLAGILADPATRRRSRRRLLPVAAAAAATAVIAGSALLSLGGRDASPGPRPTEPPAASTGARAAGSAYSLAARKVAESNARVLLSAPGWTVTGVAGFEVDSGSVVYEKGSAEVEMTWYPARLHADYVADRAEIGRPDTVTVAGRPARLYRYSADRVEALLEPDEASFVGINVMGMDADEAERLLATARTVDVGEWLAGLPREVVTVARARSELARALQGVPLPPGFERSSVPVDGVNDRYQFGARVSTAVVCAWLEEYRTGDRATALRALDGSREWPVLREMQSRGGYSEMVWSIADQLRAGGYPAGLCDDGSARATRG